MVLEKNASHKHVTALVMYLFCLCFPLFQSQTITITRI